jgi:hypothetical protein
MYPHARLSFRAQAAMELDKESVVAFIRDRGDEKRIAEAQEKLPERVDTERDGVLLAQLGVRPDDLDDVGQGW